MPFKLNIGPSIVFYAPVEIIHQQCNLLQAQGVYFCTITVQEHCENLFLPRKIQSNCFDLDLGKSIFGSPTSDLKEYSIASNINILGTSYGLLVPINNCPKTNASFWINLNQEITLTIQVISEIEKIVAVKFSENLEVLSK
jgi:hypothetical protein